MIQYYFQGCKNLYLGIKKSKIWPPKILVPPHKNCILEIFSKHDWLLPYVRDALRAFSIVGGVSQSLVPRVRFIPWDKKVEKAFSIVYPCFAFSMGFYTLAISVLNRLEDSCCNHLKSIKLPLCLFLLCLELPQILKTAMLLVIVMTVMMLVTT